MLLASKARCFTPETEIFKLDPTILHNYRVVYESEDAEHLFLLLND